ncbi:MAG: hypothetical protein WBS20_09905 [Lysobacterales bacterium]
MKCYFRFTGLLFTTLFLCLPLQVNAVTANDGDFMNAIIEGGQCGFEGQGQLQFLQNSDMDNGYKVTLKLTEMRKGSTDEKLKQHDIEAGGKKHLGCSVSDFMPLIRNYWTVVSEEKNP